MHMAHRLILLAIVSTGRYLCTSYIHCHRGTGMQCWHHCSRIDTLLIYLCRSGMATNKMLPMVLVVPVL